MAPTYLPTLVRSAVEGTCLASSKENGPVAASDVLLPPYVNIVFINYSVHVYLVCGVCVWGAGRKKLSSSKRRKEKVFRVCGAEGAAMRNLGSFS